MDVLHFLQGFIDKNGLVGALLLLFVLDKLKVVEKVKKWKNGDEKRTHRREGDPEGTSYAHIRYATESALKSLEDKLENHLAKEHQEDIEMGIIKTELKHHGEKLEKMDDDMQTVYNLISQVKNLMIERGYGKK